MGGKTDEIMKIKKTNFITIRTIVKVKYFNTEIGSSIIKYFFMFNLTWEPSANKVDKSHDITWKLNFRY